MKDKSYTSNTPKSKINSKNKSVTANSAITSKINQYSLRNDCMRKQYSSLSHSKLKSYQLYPTKSYQDI